MKYPRRWKNKISGKELLVMPWWEVVKDGEIEEVDELGQLVSESVGNKTVCKFGLLTQIGYLLENESGVWFGVNLRASDGFIDLGELKNQDAKPSEQRG